MLTALFRPKLVLKNGRMILGTSDKALEQHTATSIASLNFPPRPEHVDSRLSLRTGKGQFEIGQT